MINTALVLWQKRERERERQSCVCVQSLGKKRYGSGCACAMASCALGTLSELLHYNATCCMLCEPQNEPAVCSVNREKAARPVTRTLNWLLCAPERARGRGVLCCCVILSEGEIKNFIEIFCFPFNFFFFNELHKFVVVVLQASRMAGFTVKSNLDYQELCKVLSGDYIALAFDLPPGAGSIWSIMQGHMDTVGSEFPKDEESLLLFLHSFFSVQVLDIVRRNLATLAKSHHGLDYTLGRTKTAIGKSIIDGIREEASEKKGALAHFLGQVAEMDRETDREWQVVCTRESKAGHMGSDGVGEASNGVESSDEGGLGGAGGSRGADGSVGAGGGAPGGGSGGAGGSGGGVVLESAPAHFPSMKDNIIEIHLSAFRTPKHGEADKNLTIKERSSKFDGGVPAALRNSRFLYDPQSPKSQRVSLYHGTRTSSLESFCLAGIRPPRTEGGEFSQMPAFYTCNSRRHAFERPLHYKLGRDAEDFASVMEFRIDPRVLHGQKKPPGDSTVLNCHWFQRPDNNWKKFCIANMSGDASVQATVPLHSFDVVIGPVCKPVDGGRDMHFYGDRVLGQVYLTQIAFCTPRSWKYLESCFMRVYEEKRDAG